MTDILFGVVVAVIVFAASWLIVTALVAARDKPPASSSRIEPAPPPKVIELKLTNNPCAHRRVSVCPECQAERAALEPEARNL